jgi:hypothetical protein
LPSCNQNQTSLVDENSSGVQTPGRRCCSY